MIIMALHLLSCGVIWWATFCRLRATDDRTLFSVRAAIALTSTGAATAGLAPILLDVPVHSSVVILEFGMAAQLVAFRNIWRHGPPEELKRET